MSVLTEYALRSKLRNQDITEYEIEKDVIVTPSARQYLSDKNIKLVIKEDKVQSKSQNLQEKEEEKNAFKPKYQSIEGGFYENKPEFMTQLYGNKLVYKDHPRIVLRGKLDSMESSILSVQILAQKLGEQRILKDLDEILKFVRNILRAEVLNEELGNFCILGMNEDELREISHNPKKFFNIDHVFPSYDMGEVVIALNSLRSSVREVEICALKAFKNQYGEVLRPDIVRYLNRLSSCFYVMMCKYVSGKYK